MNLKTEHGASTLQQAMTKVVHLLLDPGRAT